MTRTLFSEFGRTPIRGPLESEAEKKYPWIANFIDSLLKNLEMNASDKLIVANNCVSRYEALRLISTLNLIGCEFLQEEGDLVKCLKDREYTSGLLAERLAEVYQNIDGKEYADIFWAKHIGNYRPTTQVKKQYEDTPFISRIKQICLDFSESLPNEPMLSEGYKKAKKFEKQKIRYEILSLSSILLFEGTLETLFENEKSFICDFINEYGNNAPEEAAKILSSFSHNNGEAYRHPDFVFTERSPVQYEAYKFISKLMDKRNPYGPSESSIYPAISIVKGALSRVFDFARDTGASLVQIYGTPHLPEKNARTLDI